MTIKQIIKDCAIFLSLREVTNYIDKSQSSWPSHVNEDINNLTNLSNLVISELSSCYIDMVASQYISPANGKILYTNLSRNVLEILEILDENGEKMPFKTEGEYVSVGSRARLVKYKYYPSIYGLEEKIGYSEKDVPSVLITYGLCAEYCIFEGRFEEAVMWRKRFTDSLKNFIKPKHFQIKERDWV